MIDSFLLLRYTFAEMLRVRTPTTFPAVAKVNKVLVWGDLFAPESCEPLFNQLTNKPFPQKLWRLILCSTWTTIQKVYLQASHSIYIGEHSVFWRHFHKLSTSKGHKCSLRPIRQSHIFISERHWPNNIYIQLHYHK